MDIKTRHNMIRYPIVFLFMATLCGCATPPSTPDQTAGIEPYMIAQRGRVVRINPIDGYVVLECTYLPRRGEEITLHRNKQISGTVRVGAQSLGNLVAADILEGTPMIGDWFHGKSDGSTIQTRQSL